VPKNLSSEAMLSAFRLVLAGEKFIPSDLYPNAIGSGKQDSDNPLQRLTEREREVLAKVLEGLTNKEIARDLNISEITVKLHARSIYRKLGARNRAQAVKIALDFGWED
jgi:DNA-binding NarL/FixJ family response regulator